MNESQVTQTALPEATPPRSEAVSRASMDRGRITATVIGTLLVLLSLVSLGAGGTAPWADRTQRDGGYVTTDVHEFSTSGAALAIRCRPSWDRRGWAGCTPRGCSTKFGYESRRRAPARRCSSGSALPRMSIATSTA